MTDDELRDGLRSLDPAADLRPLSSAQVAAMVKNAQRSGDPRKRAADVGHEPPSTHRRRPLVWLAAVAAVVLFAGSAWWWAAGSDDSSDSPNASGGKPSSTASASPGADTMVILNVTPQTGRCIPVNADLLAKQELAFEGTVTSIENGIVTLQPSKWYAGDPVAKVAVDMPTNGVTSLQGIPEFKEGQRYLVAATGGSVTPCGMSDVYNPDLAQLYSEAFS